MKSQLQKLGLNLSPQVTVRTRTCLVSYNVAFLYGDKLTTL